MKNITILFFAGEKIKDDFMHAADMFGRYKRLIELDPIVYETTIVSGETEDINDKIKEKSQILLNAMRRDCKTICVAMIVVGYPEFSWRDKATWEVSNGYKSVMLTLYLQHFGWSNPPLPHEIGSNEFDIALNDNAKVLSKI